MATSFLILFLSGMAAAQSVGKVPEKHPKLPIQTCTAAGCKTVKTAVVLDSNMRPFHAKNSSKPCWNDAASTFDKELCPDAETCAANCVYEGLDYAAWGVTTKGNAMTLKLFNQEANGTVKVLSPRVYLLDANEKAYFDFRLVGKEFTFDVDMSKLPCGTNGALYFDEMNMNGDANEYNKAGAAYGTGYCDAQCYYQKFVHGKANLNPDQGYCCAEMDIWEANQGATAYTPHTCSIVGPQTCVEPDCGVESRYDSICDKDGCDYNPFRVGNADFYSPGRQFKINTSKKVTVVTQFVKSAAGPDLVDIRRLYVQNGKVIGNPHVKYAGLDPKFDSNNDAYCDASKGLWNATNAYKALGATKGMGASLARGHVLAMSVWFDQTNSTNMKWLDGTYPPDKPDSPGAKRGPCPAGTGTAEDLEKNHRDTQVVFSNIKVGDIGTTFKGKDGPSHPSPTCSPPPPPPPYGGRPNGGRPRLG